MKPSVPLFVALVVAAMLVTYAMQFVPVWNFGPTRYEERPMRHSLQDAYGVALQALDALGGLPPDAEPSWTGALTVRSAHARAATILDANFEWRPRDVLASDDRIAVMVAENPDGTMFPRMIIRHWHPAWWRAVDQWWIRSHAMPVPAPSRIRDSCPHGVDSAAMSRVLGSQLVHVPYMPIGWPTPPPPASGSASGEWDGLVTLRATDRIGYNGYSLTVREGWISDVREKRLPSMRPIMLYARLTVPIKNRPWAWQNFESADTEHVCLPG